MYKTITMNMFYLEGFIYLWMFASFLTGCYGLQRFAEQPKYTEVNPGEDALLTCKIIDKRGGCSWQKDNKPVGIYPKKYEWAGTTSYGMPGIPSQHIGGDCSLWIRAATIDFDDGAWECQVTASDFTTQDALTSQPVQLVVRAAPQRPKIEHEGLQVPPGHNVTVDSKAVATVSCVSHYGNPPAKIKWLLGDQELQPLHTQTNKRETGNNRTWSATSIVQIPATRERHGETIKCVALHESYAAKSLSVDAKLDVKYPPTVRLLGAPQIDLEEGKDSLVLRCEADANPPASIVWKRAGRSEIASLQETLQLRPIGRRDAGLYTCQAQNSVGSSEQLSVQLDIKYAPKIISAGPDRLTTAPLYSPAAFECVAEANPPATFKWYQRMKSGYLERGHESRLVIDNVTYDYQGEYECRATNYINGQERTVASEPVSLQVVGAPQVLRSHPSSHTVSVRKGEEAMLTLIVCADPRPRHVAWEWGSLRLEAGAGFERYHVDEVSQDSREDCYLATLHIDKADIHDSRPYYLVVENERGIDRHAINLVVEGMFTDPMEMSYLLGIAGGCLTAVLLLVCLCIYAIRARKCCFKGRGNFKSSDKDSEKADLKSRSDSIGIGVGPPHLDSIYTTPSGFHHHAHHHSQGSPEAMKSTATQNDLRNSMMLNGSKHQRDLFSGSLGIPDVTTHVGRVVHDFELMSRSRGASPTGAEVHRNSDVIFSAAEQPYELHTISNAVDNAANEDGSSVGGVGGGIDKRQQAYRKSDVSINPMIQKPCQQTMRDRVHRFIDIPTPPPPPMVMTGNLPPLSPLPQEINDDELLVSHDPAASARNMQNKLYFEKTTIKYNKHTLPRAQPIDGAVVDGNEIPEQFIPASQIIRMNESAQKMRPVGGSSDANKRNVGMTRGRTFDDDIGRGGNTTTIQYGNKPRDLISANDYRRKLFGSQPNIIDYKVFNASTAIPANLNSSTMFQTNNTNIDFRENFDQQPRSKRFSQQHTHRRYPKNDTNNNYNAEQIYEPPPSSVFTTDSLGNRFLNRTNQINNNSNSNSKIANNNRSSNLGDATENWMYQNSFDDQMLLRGTTVSQSFIKSMKSAERQKAFKHSTPNTGSTSNGFRRVETPKSTTKRAARSYYRPQRYILHDDDDDDYGDELRARYTEHSSSATLASTKPLSRNFKLSKSGNRFGYRQAKPV